MQVTIPIKGEDKVFKIGFSMARNLLQSFEASGLLGLVMEVSQIKDEEEFKAKFPALVGKLDNIFDLTETFFKIITNDTITPDDFEDVEVALIVAMQAIQQIVSPLSYTLSKDHLDTLKKNTLSLVSNGKEESGKSDSPNETGEASSTPSSIT